MSNNTFTPSISCFLNQLVGFFSENRTPKSLSFDSEFRGWKWEKTGFYGFRRVVRDIAMRHCQNGIVSRQGRTILEAFCAFFFCATMTFCHSRMAMSRRSLLRLNSKLQSCSPVLAFRNILNRINRSSDEWDMLETPQSRKAVKNSSFARFLPKVFRLFS